ncbi:hypothetical protein ACVWZM_003023 [Bradyrhizobium sp. USDA 4501]
MSKRRDIGQMLASTTLNFGNVIGLWLYFIDGNYRQPIVPNKSVILPQRD